MAPVYFHVLLKLLPPSEDGRPHRLGRLTMLSCDVGTVFRGQQVFHDARVMLDQVPALQAGEEASARLDPLSPDLWEHVQQGHHFTLHLGRRLVGEGVVLQRVSGLLQ